MAAAIGKSECSDVSWEFFLKFVALYFVLSLKLFISSLANQMLWEVCRGNHKSSSVPLLFTVKLLLNMEAQYFVYNA